MAKISVLIIESYWPDHPRQAPAVHLAVDYNAAMRILDGWLDERCRWAGMSPDVIKERKANCRAMLRKSGDWACINGVCIYVWYFEQEVYNDSIKEAK